jgi:hypothetical protein
MDELMRVRFLLNMRRINGLVQFLHSNEAPRPTDTFQSAGVRADILRSIVVFLHATFEDVLRTTARQCIEHRRKTVDQLIQESVEDHLRGKSFGSCTAVDSVLKKMGLDTAPFKSLYPPLGQMMRRRHSIVHEADLTRPTDVASEAWGIVDDWQLIMWLMAVAAFYYQLRMSVNAASEAERTMYGRHRKAMVGHLDFGNLLVAFPKVPEDLRVEALLRISVSLT